MFSLWSCSNLQTLLMGGELQRPWSLDSPADAELENLNLPGQQEYPGPPLEGIQILALVPVELQMETNLGNTPLNLSHDPAVSNASKRRRRHVCARCHSFARWASTRGSSQLTMNAGGNVTIGAKACLSVHKAHSPIHTTLPLAVTSLTLPSMSLSCCWLALRLAGHLDLPAAPLQPLFIFLSRPREVCMSWLG